MMLFIISIVDNSTTKISEHEICDSVDTKTTMNLFTEADEMCGTDSVDDIEGEKECTKITNMEVETFEVKNVFGPALYRKIIKNKSIETEDKETNHGKYNCLCKEKLVLYTIDSYHCSSSDPENYKSI